MVTFVTGYLWGKVSNGVVVYTLRLRREISSLPIMTSGNGLKNIANQNLVGAMVVQGFSFFFCLNGRIRIMELYISQEISFNQLVEKKTEIIND